MAKKQTYAAAMKQLSKKKATYEKGMEDAKRVGNPSGLRDYERRLAKLNAGMDELFQAQQMANGGNTAMPKAQQGMRTKPTGKEDAIALIKKFATSAPEYGKALIDYSIREGYIQPGQPIPGMPSSVNEYLNVQGGIYTQAMKRATAEGGRIADYLPDHLKGNDASFFDAAPDSAAAGYEGMPRTIPADGSYPGAAVNDKGEYMLMKDPGSGMEMLITENMYKNIQNETGNFGQALNLGNYRDEMIFFDPSVYKKSAPLEELAPAPKPLPDPEIKRDPRPKPVATETAPIAPIAPVGPENSLGMAGARATTGDGTGHDILGTGIQLPGLDTPAGPGALPGVFGIAEQMGAFAPTASQGGIDANLRSGEDVVTSATGNGMSGTSGTSSTSKGAGRSPYLGMIAGAAAQLLPYAANLRGINKLEGPIDAPSLRAQTINTDLQVGNQLAAARNEAARNMASIDANVSNPAVAAAMKRANQRVAAGQEMQILSNEASQELQLRNQNINQLTNVLNQNAGIQAANEQRRIDFENQRMGAKAQVRQNMGNVIGGAFQDFQNRAADLRKFELMSKLDEYGVIGRNNIDDIIGR